MQTRTLRARPSDSWLRPPGGGPKPIAIPMPVADETDSALAAVIGILQDHYLILLSLAAIGALLGFVYARNVTPAYRATTAIEVQDLNENFLNLKEVASASASSSVATDLQTQLRILQSSTLVARVVQRIGLPRTGPDLNGDAPPPAPLTGLPSDAQVEAAAKGLQVRETRQSRIVDLVYESPDPVYAASFVNQLARQYIDQSVEARLEISRGTSAWLERQLQDLRNSLAESERRLQSYAGESGLLVTTESRRPDEEKLREVQSNLSKAQENRMAKQARRDMAVTAPLDSLEPPLGSALRDHRAKLADLRRQRADLVAVYTAEFDPVKRLDAQIADLEASVNKEATSVLQAISNDYVDSVRRERLIEDSYNQQVRQVNSKASKAIQYGILKNEVDSSRALYNTMLQRSAEAKVASALRASSARVVDRAKLPRAPFRPNRPLSVLSGGTTGLLLGLVWIAARDSYARRVVSSRDLAAASKVPELGAIPESLDPPAAAYSDILTSILFSPLASRTPQVIVFTSAVAGEGKSLLVFKLAATLSKLRRQVLIIDGSRNGGVQKLFGHSGEYGLRDLVDLSGEGRDLLAYVTNPTRLTGVDIASIGPEGTSVLDLMFAQCMERLLEEMRRDYDVVLIDTPALMEFPDARVFAKLSDGAVLVVQARKTSAHEVRAAAKRLQWDDTVLLGTVINRV